MAVEGVATTIERGAFDGLLTAIARSGYELIGPTIRDGAIVYDEIATSADLPIGWTDEQDGGSYRLRRRDDEALFGYAVGPQSWKRFLHPPEVTLWRASRDGDGAMAIESCEDGKPSYAFVGVRSCELHAIAIQDRVMVGGEHPDPFYAARRDGALLVAVNCTVGGGTCFCVSMGTGPRAGPGFDIALTEVIDGGRHYFLCEAGSEPGAAILAAVEQAPARAAEAAAATAAIAVAARHQGRSMEADGIRELLYDNYEHPRWDEVSERCLTCGNCTMVCPTCFCTTVEDSTDLAGAEADRTRRWDSCFTMDFSYVHGGSVRASARSRYRQWMTHKLATWIDQFGTSGCVGCGRCITWCPVAIDITEEVAAIRADAID
ncbi:MAG: sulfite reductase subunit A [Acidobacteria bacterium]|nr:MAG: sulfite reductase subunit A [Acidobacteriota bacterium]GIK78411.1 MAG: 4Fe-4S ferredoxin [Actinomycetes bacterium]